MTRDGNAPLALDRAVAAHEANDRVIAPRRDVDVTVARDDDSIRISIGVSSRTIFSDATSMTAIVSLRFSATYSVPVARERETGRITDSRLLRILCAQLDALARSEAHRCATHNETRRPRCRRRPQSE